MLIARGQMVGVVRTQNHSIGACPRDCGHIRAYGNSESELMNKSTLLTAVYGMHVRNTFNACDTIMLSHP